MMKKKKELSVSMCQDMIPVEQGELGLMVNSRLLHTQLGVGRDYSTWIKGRINEYGFVEGEDFSPVLVKTSNEGFLPVLAKTPEEERNTGGRPAIDYLVTVDVAKELAMVERSPMGRAVRRYFIEIEKRYRDWIGFVLPRLEQDVDLFGVRLGYNYEQLLGAVGLSLRSGAVNARRRKNPQEFWRNERGRLFVSEEYGKNIIAYAAARRLSAETRERHLAYERRKARFRRKFMAALDSF